jgi:hypothetical protein
MTPLDRAVDRARALDTSAVRDHLYDTNGPHRWPRFRLNEVELEWRRWRIRHYLDAADQSPGSIRLFEQLCVSAGLPPAEVDPAADGPLTTLTYDEMFPQGPLIAKAKKARVVRAAGPAETDEEYALRLTGSTTRRRDYLRKLSEDAYWWIIPDVVSEAVRRRCAAEVAELPASFGAAYDGGPSPGWDLEHDSLVSESCNAYLGAGPELIAVHEDAELTGAISERMGRRMYPTRCTYLRYRPGDYLGAHTDQPTCEVSLLFTIDGDPGPMRAYFEQTGHDPADLHRWISHHGHFPAGGRDFVYRPREGLALTGRAVPHARLPQGGPAIIAALFYSGLT